MSQVNLAIDYLTTANRLAKETSDATIRLMALNLRAKIYIELGKRSRIGSANDICKSAVNDLSTILTLLPVYDSVGQEDVKRNIFELALMFERAVDRQSGTAKWHDVGRRGS